MQKLFSFFIALFIGLSFIAQVNLDSLWSVWNDVEQEDTNKLKAMKMIAWDTYLYTYPDSSYYFAELLYKYADSINNKKWISVAYNIQGVSFAIRGHYKEALSYYKKSLSIKAKIGDQRGIANSYNNIGILHMKQSNYELALSYFEKSLKIREELNDLKGISSIFNNIAGIYHDLGNYKKVLSYHQKSLKIKEELNDTKAISLSLNNIGFTYFNQKNYSEALIYFNRSLYTEKEIGSSSGIATSYINIGSVYKMQNKLKKSLDFYQKGLKLKKEMGDKGGIAIVYNNIGGIYEVQKKYLEALNYIKKSLKIREEINDKKGIAQSYIQIGFIKKIQGNNQEALFYGKKSLKISKKLKLNEEIKNASKLLYDCYKKIGDNTNALKMYELYIESKDSLAKVIAINEGIRIEEKRKYEEFKFQDSIHHINKILLHQAQNKAKDEKIKRKDIEIKGKENENYILFTSISILIIFSFFIFNRFRYTKKQNKIIENQKKQVVEKNKEILDSIQYAKRLQEAILPPKKIIKEYLPQSFILYKPKDIVAGDFYWMESLNGWTYFAAADCTGHGVPGAMVSVVCSNALSKSVVEEKIEEPAAILNRARELVIERFVRSENEIKDGMDISLCAYHSESGKVKWAGAHNPLWIIRNESKEIEVIKADSQPIGRYDLNEPFTAHSLQLSKGDTMYLFTDGFSDQFGGEQGKKYKAAKFKRFLLSIQDKDMDVQRQTFTKEFDLWKGNMEQIDDVCVMGVRV